MPAHLPAFCPSWGNIFAATVIELGPGVRIENLGIENVRERCPRCGATAEVPDGTYSVVDDTVEVLAASNLTLERLSRLVLIVESAQAGTITDEDAARAVADEVPQIGSLIERLRPKLGRALIVVLLAAIDILAQQALAERRDDAATREDVERAVNRAIEQCQEPDR